MKEKLNILLYPGNDLLEDSPYEPVNSRLSDIFRLAPMVAGKPILLLHFGLLAYNFRMVFKDFFQLLINATSSI